MKSNPTLLRKKTIVPIVIAIAIAIVFVGITFQSNENVDLPIERQVEEKNGEDREGRNLTLEFRESIGLEGAP